MGHTDIHLGTPPKQKPTKQKHLVGFTIRSPQIVGDHSSICASLRPVRTYHSTEKQNASRLGRHQYPNERHRNLKSNSSYHNRTPILYHIPIEKARKGR
jgi:hypothetical protein